jgi:CrcB protein
MILLWVAIGGALGAIMRFSLSSWVSERSSFSPLGTFVVNISGAFALGLFVELGQNHLTFSTEISRLVATGLLGSYTTFSTLFYETFTLIEEKRERTAMVYAVGSQAAGVLAIVLGLGIARLW